MHEIFRTPSLVFRPLFLFSDTMAFQRSTYFPDLLAPTATITPPLEEQIKLSIRERKVHPNKDYANNVSCLTVAFILSSLWKQP